MMKNDIKDVGDPEDVNSAYLQYAPKMHLITARLKKPVLYSSVGIDPGVNFGFTVLVNDYAFIYWGSLVKSEPHMHGYNAFQLAGSIVWDYVDDDEARYVVEGAAYGAPFRQVELAEIRYGFFMQGLLSLYVTHSLIVPPKSIRKEIFGDGKVKASEKWDYLNHNAADSLAIALYASGLR